MKAYISLAALSLIALALPAWAQKQSTTGGGGGGSTATTGATYMTGQSRSAASSPQSMTVADEGASSGYIIGKRVDPDKPATSRAKSPEPDSTSAAGDTPSVQRQDTQPVQPTTATTKKRSAKKSPKRKPKH